MSFSRKSFASFVETKDGLTGKEYQGDLAYPKENPDYRGDTKPLPYGNKEEMERGVLVADDDKTTPLALEKTPGMDKATSLSTVAKKDVTKVKRAKLTTEEFIEKTKGMNPKELLEFVSENSEISTISDLFGNEFTPDPNQTIQYVTGLMVNSPRMMDRFVMEMKRRGGFDGLMQSLMEHTECYGSMVNAFSDAGNGKSRASGFAKSLHDNYAGLIDAVDFTESVAPEVDSRFGIPSKPKSQYSEPDSRYTGGNPEYASNGKDMFGGDPSKDMFGGEKQIGGADGNLGTSAPGSNPQFNNGMPNTGGAGMPAPNFGNGPAAKPSKKLKSENAASNLFDASAKFDHLKSLMEGACKGGNC